MRIAGGVCFHRGSSGFNVCERETEVLKERTACEPVGVDWRRARAQEAQTKGVRDVDMAARGVDCECTMGGDGVAGI